MLVFIDESGDSGLQIKSGSSRYFVVSLVVFEDNEDAKACDERITLLKKELNWNPNSEFHYSTNSNEIRKTFLEAISGYNFFYYGIVINKDPKVLTGEGFKFKSSFYKYACSLVFENAKDKLSNAKVIIDRSGNRDFRVELDRYLKKKMNNGDAKRIKKVSQEDSDTNNLLQLADYICGVINGSLKGKKTCIDHRKIVAHREIDIQIWPRNKKP